MKKLVGLISLSMIVSLAIIGFNVFIKNTLSSYAQFLGHIKEIESLNESINSEVLKSSYFLYYSYDYLDEKLKKLDKLVNHIQTEHQNLQTIFPKTFKKLKQIEDFLHKKEEEIFEFEKVNSSIKNSQIYIPRIATAFIKEEGSNQNLFKTLIKIVSDTFLLKNSMDNMYLDFLKEDLQELEKIKVKHPQLKKALVLHINNIVLRFPNFKEKVFEILEGKEKKLFTLLEVSISTEVKARRKQINLFLQILNLVFIFTIGYLGYFMLRMEKQNIKLKKLQKSLEESLLFDKLTGLPNRFSFNLDANAYKQPTFLLFNIDNFKSVNDIYGNEIGDRLLKQVASFLKKWEDRYKDLRLKVYHLGADEFGILIENNKDKAVELAKEILNRIENTKFNVEDTELFISMSSGISFEKPLFEKADIALKVAKTGRERVIVYNENLEVKKDFEKNIKILNTLKKAFDEDRVVLYYQPILNNKTNKVDKYEVLFRVIDENGNILPPLEVLNVIKGTKYYRKLTETIVNKALKTLEKYPHVKLAVNLSYDDIADEYIKNSVILNRCNNTNVINRLSFEILESESINNYEVVKDFIDHVRNCGIEFAIDDFGSGYSNFIHLINFKPDYIKIDGSLIKELPNSEKAQILVDTINQFAHKLGIKTVAEFVCCEEVYKKVLELGIDYSQGYYIGKPSPKIELSGEKEAEG